jgi:hypothetical protein
VNIGSAFCRLVPSGELSAPVKVGRASRMVQSEILGYIEKLKARRNPLAWYQSQFFPAFLQHADMLV